MFKTYFWFGILLIIFVGVHYFFIRDMIIENKKKRNDSKSGKGQSRG
jgi:hypothetical protein